MPHDAHTFNACGEMMSGWQDSLMLKLALQPVMICHQSPVSHPLVAEDFTAKVFMKSAGDRSAIDGLVSDQLVTRSKSVAATNHRPCCDLCKTFPQPLKFNPLFIKLWLRMQKIIEI